MFSGFAILIDHSHLSDGHDSQTMSSTALYTLTVITIPSWTIMRATTTHHDVTVHLIRYLDKHATKQKKTMITMYHDNKALWETADDQWVMGWNGANLSWGPATCGVWCILRMLQPNLKTKVNATSLKVVLGSGLNKKKNRQERHIWRLL